MAIRYGRGKFTAHENYIAYMNMISDHPVYESMPNLRSPDGRVNWQVSSGKTTSFYEYYTARFDWWVAAADRLGLPGEGNSNDRFSVAARLVHPTKLRACRLCGRDIYIGYMYLNANLAKRWNKLTASSRFTKHQNVCEAAGILDSLLGRARAVQELKKLFPEKADDFSALDRGDYDSFFFRSQHIRSSRLSPGFMANPPDRLDGFHDYCLDCRPKNDPGRSEENMRTYNHDRRAFMWWAEGDWKLADALYNSAGSGVCAVCEKSVDKISPDHIGPLSCGFQQNGYFEPLCGRCNSSKNRRFTGRNVEKLLHYEALHKTSVASWQVRSLWDSVKEHIRSDRDARQLSNYMRAMQDYYLRLIGTLARDKRYEFLTCLLNPEYAYFDIAFEQLNPSTLEYARYTKTENLSHGARSLAARSVRIAFEELGEYCAKPPERRKINRVFSKFLKEDLPAIVSLFKDQRVSDTDESLSSILEAESLSLDEKDRRIQAIIESESFRSRKERHRLLLSQFFAIVSARGELLGERCRNELQKSEK